MELLAVRPGGTYIDCTLGAGGHAYEILRRTGPMGRLIGFDKDRTALERAGDALAPYADQVTLVSRDFRDLAYVMFGLKITRVDGILFDLGVSSFQVLDPERGFSYSSDAPLDMRMDVTEDTTAADLVNKLPERDLAGIIIRFGEEKWARRIAAFIAAQRVKQPIASTGELVNIIKAAIPAAARRKGPHPAKRTFQALRIAVNDELGAVAQGVRTGVGFLRPGGRIVVISFHSLEDRIVKKTFRELAAPCTCASQEYCTCGKGRLRILTRKPLTPSTREKQRNPRSRSAKLRAAEGCSLLPVISENRGE